MRRRLNPLGHGVRHFGAETPKVVSLGDHRAVALQQPVAEAEVPGDGVYIELIEGNRFAGATAQLPPQRRE